MYWHALSLITLEMHVMIASRWGGYLVLWWMNYWSGRFAAGLSQVVWRARPISASVPTARGQARYLGTPHHRVTRIIVPSWGGRVKYTAGLAQLLTTRRSFWHVELDRMSRLLRNRRTRRCSIRKLEHDCWLNPQPSRVPRWEHSPFCL